ncbi:hypothetical protein QFC19_005372 [Naganishia cerealis]|uniref:Uncharacterized protein n=1 Tax=Naganishia cerealis TaxID=610337 RepID=A0ACC2VQQ8_9TREE|nr:hypothetical protein QFC19_005372 [Naganishia cerealis]
MFNGGAVDNSYRSGDSSSAATLRNRFDTWNEVPVRWSGVNLADPVSVTDTVLSSQGASASALEQEILERKRQTSIAPLIGRRE